MKKRFLALLLLAVPLLAIAKTESLAKYHALAEQGDANAEFNVGLIYYEGRSASEEGIWVEAIGESIRQGSRRSILDTEWLADKIWDNVVGKDSPDPIEQAEQAWAKMDSSNKRAAQRDSELIALRDKIQRKNYKNAAKWFGLAAKHGDAEGQYYLGVLYNRGEGVKKSDTKAIEWYRKAADQGNLNAQSLLGDSYAFGIGIEKNDAVAAEWYTKAATQGDPTAQQLLECLAPIVADPTSGAFAHSKRVRQTYENKIPVYHSKESGERFTGCTWDREPNNSNPIMMNFVNGLKHGVRTRWAGGPRSRTEWRKYSEDNYVNGIQAGLSSMWKYANGQTWFEVTYVDGKMEGIKKWWHEDGSPAAEVTFVNGNENGTYVSWYESGAKKQEAPYVNGKTAGQITNWYESGNKSAVKNMDGGHADGLQTRWYENGEMQSEGSIHKSTGLMYGPWTEYYENGQKKFVVDYLWSMQSGKYEDTRPELGHLGESSRVYWTDWYENGQEKSEGLYVRFSLKNIAAHQGSNMSNPRQGDWTDWKPDGKEIRRCFDGRKVLNYGMCESPEDPPTHLYERSDATSTYVLYGNLKNPAHPSIDPESGVITLTPVHVRGGAGVAFLKETATVPFVLTFEINIWDDDGAKGFTKRYNSADGISVIFTKDDSAYRSDAPPGGSHMGYIGGDSTMGVFFKTYETRQIFLKNDSAILAKKKNRNVYTGGAWEKAQITVNSDSIVVQFDGKTLINWQGVVPFDITSVAFGAGTGASNSRHQIRNVVLTPGLLP